MVQDGKGSVVCYFRTGHHQGIEHVDDDFDPVQLPFTTCNDGRSNFSFESFKWIFHNIECFGFYFPPHLNW